MTQKIIQVGSSAGVTIPKKELEALGLRIGDEIEFKIKPSMKVKHERLMQEYEQFVAEYDQTLKNLANR